ncbi:MAG: PTS system mannose/fructose/sorbose family transporter subunit IID, partial [Proteobacteria bacterium]|nr:PTS system mannose/fructose/sorbose family transporter subunit IID [Pseudomonadota bacterium]
FCRSLCLQASWSFQGMQSLGFAYAMGPALRRLYGAEDAYRLAVQRHLEFFNTHPFLAAAVLGAAVRLEADGGEGSAQAVRKLKSGLMGPCGAVGDSLYWGSLKPLLVVAALHLAYRGVWWAPVAFLTVFTACNLTGRACGFFQGYRRGLGVAEVLSRLDLLTWARRGKVLCAVLLGALVAAAYGPTALDAWDVPVPLWGGVALALTLSTAWVIGRGMRPTWVLILTAALCWGFTAWT